MMRKGIPCQLVSWERFYQLARALSRLVHESAFQPDIIVAIGRGGYLPARILSDHLGIFDLTSIKVEHYHGVHKERVAEVRYPLTAQIAGRRVLLVDDVSDSGETFRAAIRHLREQGEAAHLRTAVLHHKRVSGFVPDYYVEEVVEWRWIIYPWAVIEDLTSFLREMEPRPESAAEFAAYLQQQHGIEPPEQLLQDVFMGELTAGQRNNLSSREEGR